MLLGRPGGCVSSCGSQLLVVGHAERLTDLCDRPGECARHRVVAGHIAVREESQQQDVALDVHRVGKVFGEQHRDDARSAGSLRRDAPDHPNRGAGDHQIRCGIEQTGADQAWLRSQHEVARTERDTGRLPDRIHPHDAVRVAVAEGTALVGVEDDLAAADEQREPCEVIDRDERHSGGHCRQTDQNPARSFRKEAGLTLANGADTERVVDGGCCDGGEGERHGVLPVSADAELGDQDQRPQQSDPTPAVRPHRRDECLREMRMRLCQSASRREPAHRDHVSTSASAICLGVRSLHRRTSSSWRVPIRAGSSSNCVAC